MDPWADVYVDQKPSNQQPTLEEEGRYSFGTTPAVDKLFSLIQEDKRNPQGDAEEVVLVNLSTLVRNRLMPFDFDSTKPMSAQTRATTLALNDLVRLVMEDTEGIIRELSIELRQGRLRKAVIFYTMTYENQLPQELIRSDSQQRAKIRAGVDLLKTRLHQRNVDDGPLKIGIIHSAVTIPSYLALREHLAKFPASKPKVRLISHIPLDYHIYRYFDGAIIKSHTGDSISNNFVDIGKYVFKQDSLPFTVATHLLFGDKELVKGSLGIADKKKVLQIAAAEQWYMHTHSFIEESLKRNNIAVPTKLK